MLVCLESRWENPKLSSSESGVRGKCGSFDTKPWLQHTSYTQENNESICLYRQNLHNGVRKVALSYTIRYVLDSGNVPYPASKSVTSNIYDSIIE